MTIFNCLCKPYLYVFTLSVTILSIGACSDESSLSSTLTNQKADGIPVSESAGTESAEKPKQNLPLAPDISVDETIEIAAVDDSRGVTIDPDTPVLMELYVIDRAGAVGRQLPNDTAEKLKSYMFGDKLEVIEDAKGWYGIKAMMRREYEDDEGRYVTADQEEKIYIKKNEVGTLDKVVLITDDLNILSYSNIDEKYAGVENGKPLDSILIFELIDKSLFEKKRALAVNFLSTGNAKVKKENGVLSIPTAKETVKLVDIETDNDSEARFKYMGQIDFLNQYVVFGQFWESSSYIIFDSITGKQTQDFIEYPYISPDKQYIMAVYANPYDEPRTDLELYRIQNKKITPIMSAGFKNWMPVDEPKDIFWAKDGYLYLAVTHSAAFWKENGSLNDTYQYIRIKVDL
ncbi:hypothetical protein [Psychrobacter glacincola]|uniref:hypothetical protein n=1 Tax=Psychrobacter glacincola TaxID=56810 RepID=UPI0039AF3AE7